MKDQIIQKIRELLKPEYIKVTNESGFHKNHPGSPNSGESHFLIEIKSKAFKNKKLLECHKIIYDILDEQMKNGLHALRIKIIKN